MSIEVAICDKCHMRYNATEYQRCPYCANGTDVGAVKRRDICGSGWRWPWKKEEPETKAEEPEKENGPRPVSAEKPAGEPKKIELPQREKNETKRPRHTVGYVDAGTSILGEDSDAPEPASIPAPTQSAPQVPEPEHHDDSLSGRIQKLGKTTAKYINLSGGDATYPAVGWLVCVKGVYYGQTFPLKSGVNKIGRSPEMDVQLLQDESVSRSTAIKIVYDTKGNEFNALTGDSSSLCYINGRALYDRVLLEGYEEIELGDADKNMFVFIPLCNDRFQWSNYPIQSEN